MLKLFAGTKMQMHISTSDKESYRSKEANKKHKVSLLKSWFNVSVFLIQVDGYIFHCKNMFLNIHFRINDCKMFMCLCKVKVCFCALNELMWISASEG